MDYDQLKMFTSQTRMLFCQSKVPIKYFYKLKVLRNFIVHCYKQTSIYKNR